MTTSDGRLGVARLQFGNVVLLPQNAASSGDNAFKVVHGTNAAPPHTYIASYPVSYTHLKKLSLLR